MLEISFKIRRVKVGNMRKASHIKMKNKCNVPKNWVRKRKLKGVCTLTQG
jgi:hypothetical protein